MRQLKQTPFSPRAIISKRKSIFDPKNTSTQVGECCPAPGGGPPPLPPPVWRRSRPNRTRTPKVATRASKVGIYAHPTPSPRSAPSPRPPPPAQERAQDVSPLDPPPPAQAPAARNANAAVVLAAVPMPPAQAPAATDPAQDAVVPPPPAQAPAANDPAQDAVVPSAAAAGAGPSARRQRPGPRRRGPRAAAAGPSARRQQPGPRRRGPRAAAAGPSARQMRQFQAQVAVNVAARAKHLRRTIFVGSARSSIPNYIFPQVASHPKTLPEFLIVSGLLRLNFVHSRSVGAPAANDLAQVLHAAVHAPPAQAPAANDPALVLQFQPKLL